MQNLPSCPFWFAGKISRRMGSGLKLLGERAFFKVLLMTWSPILSLAHWSGLWLKCTEAEIQCSWFAICCNAARRKMIGGAKSNGGCWLSLFDRINLDRAYITNDHLDAVIPICCWISWFRLREHRSTVTRRYLLFELNQLGFFLGSLNGGWKMGSIRLGFSRRRGGEEICIISWRLIILNCFESTFSPKFGFDGEWRNCTFFIAVC